MLAAGAAVAQGVNSDMAPPPTLHERLKNRFFTMADEALQQLSIRCILHKHGLVKVLDGHARRGSPYFS
jgi:hypothetical protein